MTDWNRIGRAWRVWIMLAGVWLLGACASQPPTSALTRFDLGPLPSISSTSASAAGASASPSRGPLKVVVTAPSWLDSDIIYYRLPSAQGDQARAYANSRWLTSPTRLFGDRVRASIAHERPVLAAGDPAAAPALRIELDEFAQYFDGAASSHGVVQIRATLFDGVKLVGQTTLRAQAPAATADAAGGARALAAASDAVQGQLMQWLAAQGR